MMHGQTNIKLLNNVFRFSQQISSETFITLSTVHRYIIINAHRSSRNVPVIVRF